MIGQVIIHSPPRLVFGTGCLNQMSDDLIQSDLGNLYVIISPFIIEQINAALKNLKSAGKQILINSSIVNEPTFTDCEKLLTESRDFGADCIIGIGGGSVLDVAKIVAALMHLEKDALHFVGNGLLPARKTKLICVPTTSGTGSEVSPNSILLDEKEEAKKGIISPFLVPDASYVDPVLTISVPPQITAPTGIDALTHCIEAYANKYAHPFVDTLALDGIRQISSNLQEAIHNGKNLEARTAVSLGSMYGGMCLGPVNTAAVHALAYPLGSMFHISHGLSNALLLPWVLEFNVSAAPDRYAQIAIAMGCEMGDNDNETAANGMEFLKSFLEQSGLPKGLSGLGIKKDSIQEMAEQAMKVQRLLKNNVKEIKVTDAIEIYKNAF